MTSSVREYRIRSATPSRVVQRVRRSFQEFLKMPVGIIGIFVAVSAATYLLDQTSVAWIEPLRGFMARHVFGDSEATGELLGAIAASLITVASITFSLLLLAIQQSAGSMTHEVIDQFLQRRVNQIFFGFFIGLALFSLVTLATVKPSFNPIYGATLVLILTVAALFLLLILIYTTIHQMRPAVIIRAIHDLTLVARERQAGLLERTRPAAPDDGAMTLDIITNETGYVVGVNVERILATVASIGPDTTIEIVPSIGSFVAHGDIVARLYTPDPDDEMALAEEVGAAIDIAGERSIGNDPTHGIEQLLTIAWTSVSTSKQNPSPGLEVNHAMRDILARFAGDELGEHRGVTSPIVYHDTLLEELFEGFELLVVVSSESMQPQQFAAVMETFAGLYGRVSPSIRARIDDVILRSLPALGDHVLTSRLERSLKAVASVLERHDSMATVNALTCATERMRATVGQLHSRATRA